MRISVQADMCQGHARCLLSAPAVYQLDDEGYCASDGLDVPAGMEAEAERGADECPERAIMLSDKG